MIETFALASESGWVLGIPRTMLPGSVASGFSQPHHMCLGSLALHERGHDVESQQMPLVRQA